MDEKVNPDDKNVEERSRTLKDIILSRRSVRNFTTESIPEDLLNELIESGIYAPSGSNSQNQRFLLVTDPQEIEHFGKLRWVYPYRSKMPHSEIRKRNPSGILGNATALIFVFADTSLNNTRNNGEYYIWETLDTQNCAASIENILLQATARGIGSCWVSSTEKMSYSRLTSGLSWRKLFEDYDVPSHFKIQGCILLGYPRKYDESGFPKGEKHHGVTWGPVDRKPLEDYLIKKRRHSKTPSLPYHYSILRALLNFLLRVVRFIDRQLYRIEQHEIKEQRKKNS